MILTLRCAWLYPTYAYAETAATTSARLAVTPTNALTSVG
jgi:hypothetical protein